jgi:hypothetical protein
MMAIFSRGDMGGGAPYGGAPLGGALWAPDDDGRPEPPPDALPTAV